jgi:hypothetical protein
MTKVRVLPKANMKELICLPQCRGMKTVPKTQSPMPGWYQGPVHSFFSSCFQKFGLLASLFHLPPPTLRHGFSCLFFYPDLPEFSEEQPEATQFLTHPQVPEQILCHVFKETKQLQENTERLTGRKLNTYFKNIKELIPDSRLLKAVNGAKPFAFAPLPGWLPL